MTKRWIKIIFVVATVFILTLLFPEKVNQVAVQQDNPTGVFHD